MGVAKSAWLFSRGIRELEADQILLETLGPIVFEAFYRAKWAEIEEYRTKISDWELEHYLELA
jgi:glutamine synthetase